MENVITDREGDEVLILRYRDRGDVAALEMLVARYSDALRGYLFGILRDSAEVDDVFQEVWLRVIRRSDTYRSKNFRGWLFRIAHNAVIDRFRRRRPDISLDAAGEESLNAEEHGREITPVEMLEETEELERLGGLIRALPEAQREVFLMRVSGGLSFKDIARVLRVPLNTALGRMHYAVGKLRKAVEDMRGREKESLVLKGERNEER